MSHSDGWNSVRAAESQLALVTRELEQPVESVLPYKQLVQVMREKFPEIIHDGCFEEGTFCSLADIGCGVGHYGQVLHKAFPGIFQYFGYDSSEEMVKRSIHTPDGKVCQWDCTNLQEEVPARDSMSLRAP